ncbi:MAG: DUF512 domain-containing protein [Bacillota bacterium]
MLMPRGYTVATVNKYSPAHRVGLEAGDRLIRINGSSFYDVLDYYYLCAGDRVDLEFTKKSGSRCRRIVGKEYDENLGLEFSTPTIGPLRRCQNCCIFCFIDQQPEGLRPSLYEKDDDYRLSFLHGNYITLTNAVRGELKRIARRCISPLYISIHATDPAVRRAMMGNKAAGEIMDQLTWLAEAGISMHGQVVICPGYNDGAVLKKTIRDLAQLYPYLKTVALVPVGLTRYRRGLVPLRPLTPQAASKIVQYCSRRQAHFQEKFGTPFIYLADEFYLLSGLALPPHQHYGDYEQLENGVGLLRLFLNDLDTWKQHANPVISGKREISCVTGEAAGPFLHMFMQELAKISGLKSRLYILANRFWGGNVNVAGLLSGRDLLQGLTGKPLGEAVFIPAVMLKEGSGLFLDGISLKKLSAALKIPVIPVQTLLEIRRFLAG